MSVSTYSGCDGDKVGRGGVDNDSNDALRIVVMVM